MVSHRPCVMHHNEAGLPAELVVAQAGAACQGTLDACLELGCTAWPVKAAFLCGTGWAISHKSESGSPQPCESLPHGPHEQSCYTGITVTLREKEYRDQQIHLENGATEAQRGHRIVFKTPGKPKAQLWCSAH